MGATGIGALLGALALASRTKLQGLARLVAISCVSFGTSLILFSLSRTFIRFSSAAGAGGIFRDGADGLDEHADSSDGAGPAARDEPWRSIR